ncbi:MAG: zinc-ribbon domain-containing protein, partial [Myxococcales bacterium]|nr:zinc-ribbon domain-containing protein [Myxococcales bacterium]
MKAVCPQCGANHDVDEATLSLTGGEIVCFQCQNIFRPEESRAALPNEGLSELRGVTLLGAAGPQSDTEERYYVQRNSGKVFGPFETALIVQMIREGKLTGNEGVSKDKAVWLPILAVSQFADQFKGTAADPQGGSTRPLGGEDSLPPIRSNATAGTGRPFGFPEDSFSLSGIGRSEEPTHSNDADATTPGRSSHIEGFSLPKKNYEDP